jgi:hypothetical protein
MKLTSTRFRLLQCLRKCTFEKETFDSEALPSAKASLNRFSYTWINPEHATRHASAQYCTLLKYVCDARNFWATSRCLLPPPPLTWGRKQIQFPKRRVLSNTGRWIKSRNPEIPCVIHHRHNPSETTMFVMYLWRWGVSKLGSIFYSKFLHIHNNLADYTSQVRRQKTLWLP